MCDCGSTIHKTEKIVHRLHVVPISTHATLGVNTVLKIMIYFTDRYASRHMKSIPDALLRPDISANIIMTIHDDVVIDPISEKTSFRASAKPKRISATAKLPMK